MEFHHLK